MLSLRFELIKNSYPLKELKKIKKKPCHKGRDLKKISNENEGDSK